MAHNQFYRARAGRSGMTNKGVEISNIEQGISNCEVKILIKILNSVFVILHSFVSPQEHRKRIPSSKKRRERVDIMKTIIFINYTFLV